MASAVETIVFRIDAQTAAFERGMATTTRSIDRLRRDTQRHTTAMRRQFQQLGQAVAAISAAYIGVQAVRGVVNFGRSIIVAADNMQLLRARVEGLTGSAVAFDLMSRTADGLGVALDDVASTFSRFAIAAQDIGLSVQEVDELTETVLQLGRIGGATASDLSSGSIQLAQALASGRLQGDELRSILENMPLVARAIAEEFGVSVGQLREMGAAGELSSERVARALLGAADEAEEAFGRLPTTLEQEEERFGNAAQRMAEAVAYQFDWLVDIVRWAIREITSLMDWFVDNFGTPEQRRGMAAGRMDDALTGLLDRGEPIDVEQNGALQFGFGLGALSPTRGRQTVEDLLAFRGDERLSPVTAERLEQALATRDAGIVGAAMEMILGDIGYTATEGMPAQPSPSARGGGGGASRAARDPLEGMMRMLETAREQTRELDDQLLLWGESAAAIAENELRTRLLNAAQEEGLDLQMQWGDSGGTLLQTIEALAEEYGRVTEQIEIATEKQEYLDEVAQEALKRAQDIAATLGDGFRDLITGAASFEQVLGNVLNRLAEMILDLYIIQPLVQALGASLGGGGGGIFGSLFGGGKATGGPVSPTKAYLVGERGPEMFVPNVPGRIVPKAPAAGGGGVTIAMPISINAQGADAAALARVERQLGTLQQSLPAIVTGVVRDEARRGGTFSREVGRR